MSNDLFYSARLTLKRAKHHIGDFHAKINGIPNDAHFSYIIEPNLDGVTETHKIKIAKEFFGDLSCILFDIANNLRSALDQMAYQIGLAHIGKPPKSAKFPFGPTKEDMLNNSKGGCKELPDEIRLLFESFEPYKGWNSTLWTMNEIANSAKHIGLIPIGVDGDYIGIKVGGCIWMDSKGWDAEKYELKISQSPLGTKPHHEVVPAFDISFDHPDPTIRNKLPLPFLDSLPSIFDSILVRTEAECRRIGIIK
jgi:hypothetical protein